MWRAQIIIIICGKYEQKEFLDSNFKLTFIDKIPNFYKITTNFTYSQKSYFFKYN